MADDPPMSDPLAGPRFPDVLRTGVLGAAITLPFLLMPVSLTIDAPDVHGGWHGHLAQAIGLAFAGALASLILRMLPGSPALAHKVAFAGNGLFSLLLGWLCVRWGSEIAQQITLFRAVFLGQGPRGPWISEWFPGAALAALVIWPGLRSGVRGGLVGGVVALFSVVLGRALSAAGWLPVQADLVLPVAAAVFGWSRRGRREVKDRTVLMALSAAAVLAGAALGGNWIVGPVAPGTPPPSIPGGPLPALVSGAVAAVAVVLVVARAGRRWIDDAEAGGPWSRLALLALAAAGLALAEPLMAAAALVGEWGSTMFGPHVRPGERWFQGGPPPRALDAILSLTLAVWMLHANTRIRALHSLAALATLVLSFAIVAGAQAMDLVASAWAPSLMVSFCALHLLPLAFGRLQSTGSSPIPVAILSVAAAVFAPIGVDVLHRAFASEGAPKAMVVFAAGLALLAGPMATRALPAQISAERRVAALVLLGVARVLPIFSVIGLGLFPRAVAVADMVTIGLVGLAWRRGRLPLWVVPWFVFYVGFTFTMTYKAGTGPGTCAPIVARTPARVIVDRFGDLQRLPAHQRGPYEHAEPYDALLDRASGAALVSWKHIGADGGFLEAVDLQRPALRSTLPTQRRDGGPFWPERFEFSPKTGRTFVQMLGIGAYAMWELRVDPGGPTQSPTIRPQRALPIHWEPSHPAIDTLRDRLVLSYVPNRDATNALAQAFSVHDLLAVAATRKDRPRLEMADFIAFDPTTGNLWVPAFYDFARFALVEVDGTTLAPRRFVETGFPTVGLASDAATGRIFATNVAGNEIVVFDHETLEVRERLPAGAFPRDLVYDRARERLFVAGYGDGFVHRFSTAGGKVEALDTIEVGPLLRGVGLEPETGRVLAASACAVVELPGEDRTGGALR